MAHGLPFLLACVARSGRSRYSRGGFSMFRILAFVGALVAASLSTQALAAQSSASTTKPAPTAHTKLDTAKTTTSATTTSATATATKHHHAAWTTEQIKQAQQGLTKAGLYKGSASGQMNKETEKALKEYQK